MNNSLELLKNCKKKNLSVEMLVDVWLEEYHGIVLEDLKSDKRFYKKDGTIKDNGTWKFYNTYKVTKEQHDEWEKLVTSILPKKLGVSKNFFKHSWSMTYLNCSPTIIIDESNL
jgi:hypothetical protein